MIDKETTMDVNFDMIDLQTIEKILNNFIPRSKHDKFAIEAIKEAALAIHNGNWGIGAVLVDNASGNIICRGQNKTTRSDWHAEMDLLNNFEDKHKDKTERKKILKNCTVYTSLESCPMCLCRMISARVGTVYHIADDELGGMVHLYEQLPQSWKKLSQGNIYQKADCSEELVTIAEELFKHSLSKSNQKKVAYD